MSNETVSHSNLDQKINADLWANNSGEIESVINERYDILCKMLDLIDNEPIYHSGRETPVAIRSIIADLVRGKTTLEEAAKSAATCIETDEEDCKATLNLQYMRFYNQAILEMLMAQGTSRVCVPTVGGARTDSKCARELAGKGHRVVTLHKKILVAYGMGKGPDDEAVIPQHPFCSHVIKPFRSINGSD